MQRPTSANFMPALTYTALAFSHTSTTWANPWGQAYALLADIAHFPRQALTIGSIVGYDVNPNTDPYQATVIATHDSTPYLVYVGRQGIAATDWLYYPTADCNQVRPPRRTHHNRSCVCRGNRLRGPVTTGVTTSCAFARAWRRACVSPRGVGTRPTPLSSASMEMRKAWAIPHTTQTDGEHDPIMLDFPQEPHADACAPRHLGLREGGRLSQRLQFLSEPPRHAYLCEGRSS